MKILIADDHEVVRRGLKDILVAEFPDVEIGEASDSDETLRMALGEPWDLILLDIVMPGPKVVDVLVEIRKHSDSVRVLVLTGMSESESVVPTIRAGANGFITKQYASEELIGAIRRVSTGETYLTPEAAEELSASLRGDSTLPHDKLSPRELQIFRMIALGRAVKEIAAELDLSDKTVSTHLARIREKTGLMSHVDITRYALLNRLVD